MMNDTTGVASSDGARLMVVQYSSDTADREMQPDDGDPNNAVIFLVVGIFNQSCKPLTANSAPWQGLHIHDWN